MAYWSTLPIKAMQAALRKAGIACEISNTAGTYVCNAVFYALMRRAGVFVFPSRDEGFGLPPLEAMWLGVPTVVSNAGSLPEVCGDGAMQVHPEDEVGLANRLSHLLADAAARRTLGQRGQARARSFTWEAAARKLLPLYS